MSVWGLAPEACELRADGLERDKGHLCHNLPLHACTRRTENAITKLAAAQAAAAAASEAAAAQAALEHEASQVFVTACLSQWHALSGLRETHVLSLAMPTLPLLARVTARVGKTCLCQLDLD